MSEDRQIGNRKEKDKVDETSNKMENKGSEHGNEQKDDWSLCPGGQLSNYRVSGNGEIKEIEIDYRSKKHKNIFQNTNCKGCDS